MGCCCCKKDAVPVPGGVDKGGQPLPPGAIFGMAGTDGVAPSSDVIQVTVKPSDKKSSGPCAWADVVEQRNPDAEAAGRHVLSEDSTQSAHSAHSAPAGLLPANAAPTALRTSASNNALRASASGRARISPDHSLEAFTRSGEGGHGTSTSAGGAPHSLMYPPPLYPVAGNGSSVQLSGMSNNTRLAGGRMVNGRFKVMRMEALGKASAPNTMEMLSRDPAAPALQGEGGAELQDGSQEASESFEEVGSNSSVKVMVVVRPMLDFERAKGATDIVNLDGPTKIRLPPKANGITASEDGYFFEFDRVYRADAPVVNQRLFNEMVKPLVDRFCQGFNCTVLAYGQTGSGKTYTMGTAADRSEVVSKAPRGLIPQLMALLFSYVRLACKTFEVRLKVSYVEIYNEAINDLLVKPPGKGLPVPPARLDIREAPDGEIYIEGATQVGTDDREALAHMLEVGNAARSVAAHKLNEQSSRSHAIVTVHMDQRVKPSAFKNVPPELRYLKSKLHLVDLAGSERVKETGSTGERFNEGVSINKGLLELGNVINALTDPEGKRHVPYRNSKLTRVLQDSLGGSSETLFIACVSPADSNHDHSLSTLRYASRARNIRNHLRLNNGLSMEEELEYLRNLVQKLTVENQELRTKYEHEAPPNYVPD